MGNKKHHHIAMNALPQPPTLSVLASRSWWSVMPRVVRILLLAILLPSAAQASEPQWVRISSAHFSVLTDAGEKKGEEAVTRFEQMRSLFSQLLAKPKVNMPEPLDIIVLRNYGQVMSAPASGLFLGGEDRNYVVLNAADPDAWQSIAHPFAHLLLNHNYPPTPAWFDEGFAGYFSGIRLDDKQGQMGADPESFRELLQSSPWIPVTQLFSTPATPEENGHRTPFHAEAWLVMHYLLAQNKLGETGAYFGLVQNQKIPIEQAIQQAYGMTAAQLEQELKEYLHSLTSPAHPAPVSVEAADVGASAQSVSDAQGRALLAEFLIRTPQNRDRAVAEINSITSQPNLDNAIAHRALAWDYMQHGQAEQATEQLTKALRLDGNDPWTHYYLALGKYRAAQASGEVFKGLANMMQDLRIVLDWYPEFADAYSMLGMARVEGGVITSAMESMRAAMLLSPRNQKYSLNMALIYLAGKKWDAAGELLQRLKASSDPQIVKVAEAKLAELPALRKYGATLPAPAKPAPEKAPQPPPAQAHATPEPEEDLEEERKPPPAPEPDRRKVQFLKGKLLRVDCSQPPVAVLSVVAGAKTLKLRTEDYKSVLLIGEDNFSCAWTNRSVAVNYKAGGKSDGDLVSLELQ